MVLSIPSHIVVYFILLTSKPSSLSYLELLTMLEFKELAHISNSTHNKGIFYLK